MMNRFHNDEQVQEMISCIHFYWSVPRVSKNDLQSPIFVPGIWTSLTSHPSISRPIDRVFRIDFVIAW